MLSWRPVQEKQSRAFKPGEQIKKAIWESNQESDPRKAMPRDQSKKAIWEGNHESDPRKAMPGFKSKENYPRIAIPAIPDEQSQKSNSERAGNFPGEQSKRAVSGEESRRTVQEINSGEQSMRTIPAAL